MDYKDLTEAQKEVQREKARERMQKLRAMLKSGKAPEKKKKTEKPVKEKKARKKKEPKAPKVLKEKKPKSVKEPAAEEKKERKAREPKRTDEEVPKRKESPVPEVGSCETCANFTECHIKPLCRLIEKPLVCEEFKDGNEFTKFAKKVSLICAKHGNKGTQKIVDLVRNALLDVAPESEPVDTTDEEAIKEAKKAEKMEAPKPTKLAKKPKKLESEEDDAVDKEMKSIEDEPSEDDGIKDDDWDKPIEDDDAIDN
jgi:hypothetical protein